jgi:hypothetical protein
MLLPGRLKGWAGKAGYLKLCSEYAFSLAKHPSLTQAQKKAHLLDMHCGHYGAKRHCFPLK